MDLTLLGMVAVAAAALAGATVQGAIGFGMNLVTVPVLALVAPEALPVAPIVFGVPISIAMARHERAEMDRPGFAALVTGRVPGTVLGALLVAVASTAGLRVMVACFILAIAVMSAIAPPIPVRRGTQLVVGAISGVTGTSAGIGGPPVALLYQHHRGPTMRSTLAATFLVGTVMSMSALLLSGAVELAAVVLGGALAPMVVAGTLLGRRLHDLLERGWLRPAVLVFSAASAIWVLIDTAV